MTTIKPEEHMLIDEFYAQKFYFSYSSLNKLMYAPQLFYKDYILKQREDETSPALLQGKLIHCLCLDDASFDKQFILLPGNMPSDNPKKVIDAIFEFYQATPWVDDSSPKLEDYKDQIIQILKDINLHQTLKTDEQRLEKMLTDQNKEYFQFLVKKEGRDIVDIPTLEYCTEVADLIKNHPQASQLLGINPEENVQVFNELPIQTELKAYPFGVKGIVDNLKINLDQKIIHINDIKTTSKTLLDFPETVEFYNLWMQATLYKLMVSWEFIINNGMDPKDWQIIFTFIVVDKYKQIYPYEVSTATMEEWQNKLAKSLTDANWHYASKRYDLPCKLARSQVFL